MRQKRTHMDAIPYNSVIARSERVQRRETKSCKNMTQSPKADEHAKALNGTETCLIQVIPQSTLKRCEAKLDSPRSSCELRRGIS